MSYVDVVTSVPSIHSPMRGIKLRISLVLVAIALSLSGCASFNKQTISPQEKATIQGQSVAVTSRKKPDFAAMTAGKAAFALLGAIAAVGEGNSIIVNNNVADPADAISLGLAKSLEASHSMKVASTAIPVAADDAPSIAGAAGASATYALDVQTINWSVIYFPTDWTHYRVIYTAKARLINTQSKSVIAEGFCKRMPETNDGAPTYDELMGNQAAGLKTELDIAAKECINTLKSEMLAI